MFVILSDFHSVCDIIKGRDDVVMVEMAADMVADMQVDKVADKKIG